MIIFKWLEDFGRFVLLLRTMIHRPESFPMYWKELTRQMISIGIGSLIIVGIIAFFMGAVTAVQFAYQLDGQLVPRYYIGYIVRDMAIIETAPTITCLVLAGKVGSNMAAELGGMRQKEHIDAMELMGVNTAAYLILPKLLAAILIIPLLVSAAGFISILGGYAASVGSGELSDAEYVRGVRSFFDPNNFRLMYVKAVVFSFILTGVACFQGYFVKGGSIELGKASTRAVVYSNILILLADYLIAVLLTT